jgi:hypothetical protein
MMAIVTVVEKIRTMRSRSSGLFAALFSVRTAKRAFRAYLRIATNRIDGFSSCHGFGREN